MTRKKDNAAPAALARKIFLSKPFRITVLLLLVYTLVGFFLTPYLVKRQLVAYTTEQLDRQVAIAELRVNPFALTVELAGVSLSEANRAPILSFERFFLNFELKSLFRWAWTFAEIGLTAPVLHVDIGPDGMVNLARLLTDLTPETADADQAPPADPDQTARPPRLVVERLTLLDGQVEIVDQSDPTPATASFAPINIAFEDLTTLPEVKGPKTITATLPQGGTLEWKGELSLQPLASQAEIQVKGLKLSSVWEFLQDELNLERPGGALDVTARYRFSWRQKKAQLAVDPIQIDLSALDLTLRGSERSALTLEKIGLSDGRFDLTSRELVVGHLEVARGEVAVQVSADGRLNWQDVVAPGAPSDPSANATSAEPGEPLRLLLQKVTLDEVAFAYGDRSRMEPIGLAVDRIGLDLSVDLRLAADAPQVLVDDIGVRMAGLTGRQIDTDEPLVQIEAIALGGGQVSLAQRSVDIEKISLTDGNVEFWLDPEGRFNWVRSTAGRQRRTDPSDGGGQTLQATPKAQGPPWSVRLAQLDLATFDLRLADRRLSSPEIYALQNIRLNLREFRSDAASPFGLGLAFDVAQGGTAAVEGEIDLSGPSVTADVEIDALALPPLQPYLAQVARLSLDAGALSTVLEVAHGVTGEGALAIKGATVINDLQLNLSEAAEAPFLAAKSLAAEGIDFRTEPGSLVIEEIHCVAPSGQVIVKADQTVNLQDLLIANAESPPDDAPAAPRKAAFPYEVRRVRLEKALLDFSDLSLTPQFSAKIHDLSGTIVGLASTPGSRASMKLEGRVDDYGTATIEGELQPHDATEYSDVSMRFRNLEMTHLTPYSATFAGRKITSGKLSLDLDYDIKARRLEGDNQIIIDSLTLGDRVDGPKVKDLPLDLAIALLKDKNDRIDIGLPVTGDLDDPKFSYGHIIWQAISNLLVKIASSPFRALAALVGAGEDNLDTVSFASGSAKLPPPEAEKLVSLAQALTERPQLALEVQGQFSSEADGPVLSELAVKHAISAQLGLSIDADQDPGPLSFTEPRTQQALGSLAGERLAPDILVGLQERYGLAPVTQPPGELPEEEVNASAEPPAADPAGYYADLFKQLAAQSSIEPAVLEQLASDRAAAIIRELESVGGVDSARMAAVAPTAAEVVEEESVAAKLKIVVLE